MTTSLSHGPYYTDTKLITPLDSISLGFIIDPIVHVHDPAVYDLYRKKSWILDTLYIQLKSPDLEILPFNNHKSGSL